MASLSHMPKVQKNNSFHLWECNQSIKGILQDLALTFVLVENL